MGHALRKPSSCFTGSDMTIDDRSFVMQVVMTMSVPTSVVYFYPQLMPLHTVNVDSKDIPFPIRCSVENMEDGGVYLLGKSHYIVRRQFHFICFG